jgi:hypothetical protein
VGYKKISEKYFLQGSVQKKCPKQLETLLLLAKVQTLLMKTGLL